MSLVIGKQQTLKLCFSQFTIENDSKNTKLVFHPYRCIAASFLPRRFPKPIVEENRKIGNGAERKIWCYSRNHNGKIIWKISQIGFQFSAETKKCQNFISAVAYIVQRNVQVKDISARIACTDKETDGSWDIFIIQKINSGMVSTARQLMMMMIEFYFRSISIQKPTLPYYGKVG